MASATACAIRNSGPSPSCWLWPLLADRYFITSLKVGSGSTRFTSASWRSQLWETPTLRPIARSAKCSRSDFRLAASAWCSLLCRAWRPIGIRQTETSQTDPRIRIPLPVSVVMPVVAANLAWLHDADARFGISALLGKGEHRVKLTVSAPAGRTRHALTVGAVITGAGTGLVALLQAVSIGGCFSRAGAKGGNACQGQSGQKCLAHEITPGWNRPKARTRTREYGSAGHALQINRGWGGGTAMLVLAAPRV